MRNIFLEKSYIKFGGKTSPRSFSKKSELNKSLDQQSEIFYSLFLLHLQVEGYRNILKLRCRPLAFSENKNSLEIIPLPHFLHDFVRKIFLTLQSINWLHFTVWSPLLLEILGNVVIVVTCYLGFDVINIVINLSFLIKPFYHMTQKMRTKIWIS